MFSTITKTRIYNFIVISMTMSLLACGGGDSGGGNSGYTGTAPTTPIAITDTNSNAIAKQASSNDINSKPSSGTGRSSAIVIQAIKNNQSNVGISAAAVADICTTGTATGPNAGASGTYTFTNCNTGTETLNGSITVSGGSLLANSFSGNFVYNAFSVTENSTGTTVTINGAYTISWNSNAGVETGRYYGDILGFKVAEKVVDITNFDNSYESTSSIEKEDIQYTLNSTALNGSVTVKSLVQIQTNNGRDFPFAGQMLITGANGANGPSKLRMTVMAGGIGLPTDMVKVEVDADGDGTYEVSNTVPWSQL